jgi:hypothetical protein
MGITKSLKIGVSAGAVFLLPLISVAKEPSCVTRAGTPPSNTRNCSREASVLLRDIRDDALRASHEAVVLQIVAQNPDESWASRAYALSSIQAEVDDMGKRLYRLQAMEPAIEPWQQDAVKQIAPLVRYMADNTDDAIHYLNSHQESFWGPPYRTYAGNLYTEAALLQRQIHRHQKVARQPQFGA